MTENTHTHTHQAVEEGLLGRIWPSELWKRVGFSVGFLNVIIDDSNNLPFGNVESKGPTVPPPPFVPTQEIKALFKPYQGIIVVPTLPLRRLA